MTRQNIDRLLSHPSYERYRSWLGEPWRLKCPGSCSGPAMFGSLPTEPNSTWPSPSSRSLPCCRLPQKDYVWIFSWPSPEFSPALHAEGIQRFPSKWDRSCCVSKVIQGYRTAEPSSG